MMKAAKAGEVPLTFESFGVVALATVGMLPAGIWLGFLALPLWLVPPARQPTGWLALVLSGVATAAGLFIVLVGPGLASWLVLRARQPLPARLTWDADGLTEWNGEWKRTFIPWARLVVAWQLVPLRGGYTSALQLKDSETGAILHCWGMAPSGAPPVRRRVSVTVQQARAVVAALDAHVPGFERARDAARERDRYHATVGSPDWSLAADRWAPRWVVRVGRLGYVGAVVAPLLAIAPPPTSGSVTVAATLLAVLSAALLVLRAQPARRELATLSLALAAVPAQQEQARTALRSTLKAARAELAVRSAFPILVLYSTLVSALFSRAHP